MAASVLASILRFPAVGRRPGPGQARELPGGEMACVVYQRPYEGIGEAYNAIMAWWEPNGYRIAGPVRESYLRSPGNTDDPAQPRRTHSPAVIQHQPFPLHLLKHGSAGGPQIDQIKWEARQLFDCGHGFPVTARVEPPHSQAERWPRLPPLPLPRRAPAQPGLDPREASCIHITSTMAYVVGYNNRSDGRKQVLLQRCARSEGSWPCGCRHRSLSSGASSRLPGVDPFQCRYAG